MVRAQIIATIGPASNDDEVIKDKIRAGADIIRINMSHTNVRGAADKIERINNINHILNTDIPVMLDLKGPEIRIGEVKENTMLKKGSELIVCTRMCVSDDTIISITPKESIHLFEVGDTLVVNDSTVVLEVTKAGDEAKVKVKKAGTLSSRKGIHIVDKTLDLPFLNEDDIKTLEFAGVASVPYVALSFVNRASDVLEAKQIINNDKVKVYTKVETKDAICNLEEIIDESDGIIVARGDLSITMPYHELGIITKKIVAACKDQDKPVYLATDVLQSMMTSPKPTKAEIADITHVISSGVTGCLLAGETAVGKYPVKSVAVLNDIMAIVERNE